jgi:uncharacterized protein (TIGR01244 family)
MNIDTVNLAKAAENKWTAGQPSETELQQMADLGITTVINLRPNSEWPFDEAKVAAELGLSYHHIPVEGAADITTDNATNLHKLIGSLDNEATLVHCASGNRVGALIALAEASQNNQGLSAALAIGKQWGLTSLEPLVVEKIRALQSK